MKSLSKLVFIIVVSCTSLCFTANSWCVTEGEWSELVDKIEKGARAELVREAAPDAIATETVPFAVRISDEHLTYEDLHRLVMAEPVEHIVRDRNAFNILIRRLPIDVAQRLLCVGGGSLTYNADRATVTWEALRATYTAYYDALRAHIHNVDIGMLEAAEGMVTQFIEMLRQQQLTDFALALETQLHEEIAQRHHVGAIEIATAAPAEHHVGATGGDEERDHQPLVTTAALVATAPAELHVGATGDQFVAATTLLATVDEERDHQPLVTTAALVATAPAELHVGATDDQFVALLPPPPITTVDTATWNTIPLEHDVAPSTLGRAWNWVATNVLRRGTVEATHVEEQHQLQREVVETATATTPPAAIQDGTADSDDEGVVPDDDQAAEIITTDHVVPALPASNVNSTSTLHATEEHVRTGRRIFGLGWVANVWPARGAAVNALATRQEEVTHLRVPTTEVEPIQPENITTPQQQQPQRGLVGGVIDGVVRGTNRVVVGTSSIVTNVGSSMTKTMSDF